MSEQADWEPQTYTALAVVLPNLPCSAHLEVSFPFYHHTAVDIKSAVLAGTARINFLIPTAPIGGAWTATAAVNRVALTAQAVQKGS